MAAFEANQHCQWLQAAQARLQPIGRRAVRASAPAPLTAAARAEVVPSTRPQPRTRTSNVMLRQQPAISSISSQVSVQACGVGGLEELQRQLDDRTVAWALLRFQVGGGSFVRTKMVLIQLNGSRTPALQRGLLNARSKEVLRELGEVNASLQVSSGKDLTLDYLCERLLPFFSMDHMEYSLQGLKSEYESMVKLQQQRALETPPPTEPEPTARPPRGSRTQRRSAVGSEVDTSTVLDKEVSLDQALLEVAEDGAFYNWLLLDPLRMSLHKAGAGGFEDLQAHLVDDRVLFGLLRLSFGSAAEGRVHGLTKHVLIHWVGPHVGAVRRGLCGAKYGEVSALFGGYCSVAFRHEANQSSDLRLEEIILKLQRLTVVDSVTGDVATRISLEEYNMARVEELRRQEARRSEPKRPKQVPRLELVEEPRDKAEASQMPLPDLKTALRMVRDPKGHINWVLCSLAVNRLPPSPCRAFAQMEVRRSRAAG